MKTDCHSPEILSMGTRPFLEAYRDTKARVERLPAAGTDLHDPINAGWNDDGVWFDDWGRNDTDGYLTLG